MNSIGNYQLAAEVYEWYEYINTLQNIIDPETINFILIIALSFILMGAVILSKWTLIACFKIVRSKFQAWN